MEEQKEVHVKSKKNITDKCRENPWILSTFVLGIFVVVMLISSFGGIITGKTISEKEAGDYLVEYLSYLGYEGFEVENVESDGSMYLIETSYQGEEIPFYITKTGYIIGNQLISIIPEETKTSEEDSSVDIPKSNKPVVELFVMTHCPYGTQAEKGILPVFELLGDKIDANIRFVHYFMHEPEETETPRQVCIREEQLDKYLDYLKCFLEDGNSERCLVKVGIDKSKLNNCISSAKADEYYEEDSDLSQGYGVRGSPTLVINGKIVNSGRSPAAYLDTICQAFNNPPEKCGTQLPTTSYSAGFGYEGTGSNSGAQCG